MIFFQVSATVEDKPPPSETPHPGRNDGLDQTLASHLGSVAFKLALSDNEIEVRYKDLFSFYSKCAGVMSSSLLSARSITSTSSVVLCKLLDTIMLSDICKLKIFD